MRMKLLLATFIVAAAPGLALAQCIGGKHEQVTMSCPEGQTFDTASESCKPLPTG